MLRINVFKGRVVLFALVFFLLITGPAFVRRASSTSISASSGSSVEPSPPQSPPPAPLFRQMVRVFIHGDDLYPYAVAIKQGRVLLRVENETQTDFSLMLEMMLPGQASLLIANVKPLLGAKRVDQELVLAAGTYVYFEQTHPSIQRKLIVQ